MTAVHTRCSLLESCVLFTLLISSVGLVNCEDDVITKFFSGYDKTIRPGFDEGNATVITVELEIESFGNIEEANMKVGGTRLYIFRPSQTTKKSPYINCKCNLTATEHGNVHTFSTDPTLVPEYKVYAYFRQVWTDLRLAGKLNQTLVIKTGDIESIWVPDPYCYNARESNMMMPDAEVHSSVSIRTDGTVFYSKGITLVASCVMDLKDFPLDAQSCYLKFGSYSYTTESIVFKWKGKEVPVGNKEMAQFEFQGTKLTSGENVFSIGNYSTLTATFSFKRRIGYYLIQVYFPDIFVVALSWIVFWMDKEDMGNRMALGITIILTIMFLLGSLNGTMPKVSYPKALDWYLLASFVFVFLSLVECMAVFIFTLSATAEKEQMKCKFKDVPLSRKISSTLKSALSTKKDKMAPTDDIFGNGVANSGKDNDLEMVVRASKANKAVEDDGALQQFAGRNKKEQIAEAIDKAARVLFPLSFVIFNIFYWVYY